MYGVYAAILGYLIWRGLCIVVAHRVFVVRAVVERYVLTLGIVFDWWAVDVVTCALPG